MLAIIFTICVIVIAFAVSKNEEPEKSCRYRKSTKKKTMDKKQEQNTQCLTPNTERSASGRNWELFKSLVFKPTVNTDNSGKENVKKKTRHPQKPRKKYQPAILHLEQVQPKYEDESCDESKKKITKQIAMDCEMVGIGDGTESMLARVSIVNRHGYCIYDKYVKPREPVQDYRTNISGIRPMDLQNGEEFKVVQKEVADILRGRVLVGHALRHDLDVLYLSHPRKQQRDTSKFKTFKQLSRGNTPSLKKLASELLGREIQTGEHNSIEDARAAMQLYMLYKNKWESEFYSKR